MSGHPYFIEIVQTYYSRRQTKANNYPLQTNLPVPRKSKGQYRTRMEAILHKIVQTQDCILVLVTGGTDLGPVHARTVLPVCSYGIASMFLRYCLYARTVLPP